MKLFVAKIATLAIFVALQGIGIVLNKQGKVIKDADAHPSPVTP